MSSYSFIVTYCDIVSAVHVAISYPCSPKHPLLSGLFDNFFPRALPEDNVNAEVWSFLRGEETDPFVDLSSWFYYSSFLKSGTVVLVHLVPKVERGERRIFCVGEGFTDLCLFLYWSLGCSQTVSPSTPPFPQWRLLLEPFIWSASWVHEQGISVLYSQSSLSEAWAVLRREVSVNFYFSLLEGVYLNILWYYWLK